MNGNVAIEFSTFGAARFAFITLDRPQRANSLTPQMIERLNQAIDQARSSDIGALVLRSNGSFFSSGGDIAGFSQLSGQALMDYANQLVGGLQKAVLALYRLTVPVIVRLQGGVTGGAAGLAFAADLVAMDEKAFIQPYYTEMGFAPDGGWTALLASRIGADRCFSIQALNRRLTADDALKLGLADQLAGFDELDGIVTGWLETLSTKSREAVVAAKKLLRDDNRIRQVESGLDAEKKLFLELIALPDTAQRMKAFLA